MSKGYYLIDYNEKENKAQFVFWKDYKGGTRIFETNMYVKMVKVGKDWLSCANAICSDEEDRQVPIYSMKYASGNKCISLSSYLPDEENIWFEKAPNVFQNQMGEVVKFL